jgi:hypothetical protein
MCYYIKRERLVAIGLQAPNAKACPDIFILGRKDDGGNSPYLL